MRLISWNVNGIRAAIRQGFLEFLEETAPDVLCLQEVRAEPGQVDAAFDGYHTFWNPAQKKGYSGTMVLSRSEPIAVRNGMDRPAHDTEGRVITAEYEDFYVVTVYTPNSRHGLVRLDYRSGEWDVDFLAYLKHLERTKPVIFCGDLNVAHKEIDLARPKDNVKNPGFTPEERAGFDNIVAAGFIDTFREFTSAGGHYSWWSNRGGSRERNIGWRIDYFCISPALRPRLTAARILPHVLGSDHCPVEIELA